jgi:uncharacterized protein YcbX
MTTTTLQDQYAAFARNGQEAAIAVLDAWTQSFRNAAVKLPSVTAQAATHEAIDQVFDLAVTLIDVQRNFTKQLATATTHVAEDAANRATQVATEATTAVAKARQAAKPTA